MPESFLHYIQNTYPANKAYALAALQDAQSILKTNEQDTFFKLRCYFKMTTHEWSQVQAMIYTENQTTGHPIHICTGPVCTRNGSNKLIIKTTAYIEKKHLKCHVNKTRCQAKCQMSPVVETQGKVFSPCRSDRLFIHLDKTFT